MFVHRRCIPANTEILEGVNNARFGQCEACKSQGTIFWVLGTDKTYNFKKGGTWSVGHLDKDKTLLADGPRGSAKFGEKAESNQELMEAVLAIPSEEAEIIEDKKTFKIKPVKEVKVTIPIEVEEVDENAVVKEATEEVTQEAIEEASEPESEASNGTEHDAGDDSPPATPTEEVAETNITQTLDEQIAELQARKAKLEET